MKYLSFIVVITDFKISDNNKKKYIQEQKTMNNIVNYYHHQTRKIILNRVNHSIK